MARYFMNKIDEHDRYVRLDVYDRGTAGQDNSHGMSYLGARKQYQQIGQIMGLDKLVLMSIKKL